jgi:hypothetical protein
MMTLSGSNTETASVAPETAGSHPDEAALPDRDRHLWRIIGASQRGRSHLHTGAPNQDAIDWTPKHADGANSVSLAVADGHGSAKHFRSAIGSRIAVDVLLAEFSNLALSSESQANLSTVKRAAQDQLPAQIVRTWRTNVDEHLRSNPFTDAEWERLVDEKGASERRLVEANPAVAYGSTILGVLVTPSFILYIQLGDGDILCVTQAGEASHPLPGDERLIGNETTSLCTRDAWAQFRVRLSPVSSASPEMILVSTDGYANSFPGSDSDFLKIGSDYLNMARARGLTYVQDHLGRFLEDTSMRGSGDDITLGIIKRLQASDFDTLSQRIDDMTQQIERKADSEDVRQLASSVRQIESQLATLGSGVDKGTQHPLQVTVNKANRKAALAVLLAAITLVAVITIYIAIILPITGTTLSRAARTH